MTKKEYQKEQFDDLVERDSLPGKTKKSYYDTQEFQDEQQIDFTNDNL